MSGLIHLLSKVPREFRAEVRKLFDADPASRIAGVQAIVASGAAGAARALAERLPDASLEVTRHILHGLWKLEPGEARKAAAKLQAGSCAVSALAGEAFLLEVSRDASRAEDLWAAAELLRDPPRILALIPDLESPDAEVRGRVARRLAALRGNDAVCALFPHLKTGNADLVRSVLEFLRRFAPKRLRQTAGQLLARDEPEILEIAMDVLARGDAAAADTVYRAGAAAAQGLYSNAGGKCDKIGDAAGRALVRHRLHWTLKRCQRVLEGQKQAEMDEALKVLELLGKTGFQAAGDAAEEGKLRWTSLLAAALETGSTMVKIKALYLLHWKGWFPPDDILVKLLSSDDASLCLALLKFLEEHGAQAHTGLALKCLSDPCARVRIAAIRAAGALGAPKEVLRPAIRELFVSAVTERESTLPLLAKHGTSEDIPLARAALKASHGSVRSAALAALRALAPLRSEWLAQVRRALKDRDWNVRAAAARLLQEHGKPEDTTLAESFLADPESGVRRAGLQAAVKLCPARTVKLARRMLADASDSVVAAAWEILGVRMSGSERIAAALDVLPRARGDSGALLLRWICEGAPERLAEAMKLALESRSAPAKMQVVDLVAQRDPKAALKIALRLAEEPDLRLEAFKRISELSPEEGAKLALLFRGDSHPGVRQRAVDIISRSEDPRLLECLLPLTRDVDPEIRRKALLAVGKLQDPRVMSEIISSLNDISPRVSEAAHSLLGRSPVPMPPEANRLIRRFTKEWAKKLRAEIDAVNLWGSQTGFELLGKPVAVLNYRQGLGRTSGQKESGIVEIEVSDQPMTTRHAHGEEIMKGLALHEIGHHLCDIGVRGDLTHRGKARSQGFGEVYAWLQDERLERALRSRRPEWGVYFDRLASYAFAQEMHRVPLSECAGLIGRGLDEVRQAVSRGELPGKLVPPGRTEGGDGGGSKSEPAAEEVLEEAVMLSDGDMLRIPGLVPPHAAFLSCLRCGFDPRMVPDPRVREAIALVPGDLKDLSHKDLFEVARRISALLGPSDTFQREMGNMAKRLSSRRGLLRAWDRILDRLGRTGRLPGWLWKEAEGIRIARRIVYRPPETRASKGGRGQVINLGSSKEFERLSKEEVLAPDPAGNAAIVAGIRAHVRKLRWALERLGRKEFEEPASPPPSVVLSQWRACPRRPESSRRLGRGRPSRPPGGSGRPSDGWPAPEIRVQARPQGDHPRKPRDVQCAHWRGSSKQPSETVFPGNGSFPCGRSPWNREPSTTRG